MTKSPSTPGVRAAARQAAPATAGRQQSGKQVRWAIAAVLAVVALVGLFVTYTKASSPSGGKGAYQVGSPGIGQQAPDFALAGTGGTVSLSGLRGKTVLLYFQEGLTCQPCWDQMTSLEKDPAKVKAAGVDQIVSITSDPADLIAQKTKDMGLATPVLSDPDLAVSKQYQATSFGMMGAARDGHSFVLVGPDGVIRWRADYGGAPKYTMFVPVDQLLSDLKTGERP
ncbi:MAG: peroxiredoxin family protein [Catenulispora sp.]|nr:peroxiredoxin family protein [Catenulispora sp.]